MVFNWCRAIKQSLLPKQPRSQRSAGQRGTRPRLEALETRCLPATFIVSTNLDSGPGSLRDAITQVNSHSGTGIDVINFNFQGTTSLESALPTITVP